LSLPSSVRVVIELRVPAGIVCGFNPQAYDFLAGLAEDILYIWDRDVWVALGKAFKDFIQVIAERTHTVLDFLLGEPYTHSHTSYPNLVIITFPSVGNEADRIRRRESFEEPHRLR
jgi:hypothetical protein